MSRAVSGLTWTGDVPFPAKGRCPATGQQGAQAVYFPSCISRVMGRLPGEAESRSLMEVVLTLGERAGVSLYLPADTAGACCGVPFSSKGYDEAREVAVNRTIERFWRWSDEGRLFVFLDTSPCSHGLRKARKHLTPQNQERFDRLRILDSIAFVHEQLLPKLTVRRRVSSVALHPVCSVTKMGLGGTLEAIAAACAEKVVVPAQAGCCGFAGDRGFLVPELTEAASGRKGLKYAAASTMAITPAAAPAKSA